MSIAAVLSSWPRADSRGFPFLSLAVLLVLVVTPITAIGAPRSLVLGCAIAALTVCFLWLERLPLRPGMGVAVLGGIALAGALPLSLATDRAQPWLRLPLVRRGDRHPASVRFDWEPTYGPIAWQRDGREMLRIKTDKPQYWKLENLEDFDGQRWVMRGVPDAYGPGRRPTSDPSWSAARQWTGTATVTVRGLRGSQYAGAGTTLSVDCTDRPATPTFSPGTWQADRDLKPGDSYRIRFHAPRPNALPALRRHQRVARPAERRAADRAPAAQAGAPRRGRHARPPGHVGQARAAAFDFVGPPLAVNERRGTVESGLAALRNSPYWRTWQLAQRLKRGTRTPCEFVRAIDSYLGTASATTEHPAPAAPGRAPLEPSCSTARPATASTSRRDGAPAAASAASTARGDRVSPRRLADRQDEWVVRDPDAHSWVEAWFDGIGWVAFDPTPSASPARSLIAAIAEPGQQSRGAGANDAAAASPAPATLPARIASSTPGRRRTAPARPPAAGRAHGCTSEPASPRSRCSPPSCC